MHKIMGYVSVTRAAEFGGGNNLFGIEPCNSEFA